MISAGKSSSDPSQPQTFGHEDYVDSKPLDFFVPGRVIAVHDKMQRDYEYTLSAPMGKGFAEGFSPVYTPAQMLQMGVFGGKYCNDCIDELPREWLLASREQRGPVADIRLNFFGVSANKSLAEWREAGWITADDPDVRGWFQWYWRYFLGRRNPRQDQRQIGRWRAFKRHAGQVKKHCAPRDLLCRPRQRQALLCWSHWCGVDAGG